MVPTPLGRTFGATVGASAAGPTQGHSGKGVPVPPKPAQLGEGRRPWGSALSRLRAGAQPAAPLPPVRGLGFPGEHGAFPGLFPARPAGQSRELPQVHQPHPRRWLRGRRRLLPICRHRGGAAAAPGRSRLPGPPLSCPAPNRGGPALLPCGSATGGCSFPAGVGPEPGAGIASAFNPRLG